MSSKLHAEESVKARIMRVASKLFYEQGYHQTGTNQLIREAHVSKASFYEHFPSKEALGLAYVKENAASTMAHIAGMTGKIEDPRDRFLSFGAFLEGFMKETNYRGCSFTNIAREFPDLESPIRKAVHKFESAYLDSIAASAEALLDAEPQLAAKLKLNARELAERYYLLTEGALTAAANLHDLWPLKAARNAVEDLISP